MKAPSPDIPRRLIDEAVSLKQKDTPPWTPRRANKMRERFDTYDAEMLDTLSLTAPVQPMPRVGTATGSMF